MSQQAVVEKAEFSIDPAEVAQSVVRLVQETAEDLRNFREEQSQLRNQISSVVEENHYLGSELDKFQKIVSSNNQDEMQQRLHFTGDALAKAMAKIESLQKERRCLQQMQECSQRTIHHMETELQTYRTQMPLGNNEVAQIAQKYNQTVKTLECKLKAQDEELRTQAELIKALHEHKQRYGEKIQHLQSKLKARTQETTAHEEQLEKIGGLHKQLKEFEKSLLYTRTLLDESTKREETAMRKVQEALSVSEAAVREKTEAEKKAVSYKEEAAQLASNIGSIMDEAAKRVDSEVAKLKAKLTEKNKTISSLREKLKEMISQNKSLSETMTTCNEQITQKYKEAVKQNEHLQAHLETVNKRLNDLEKSTYNDETNHVENKKDYEGQIEHYLHAYKDLKEHYKQVLHDLTHKFETEFEKVQREKCELQAENELLKNGGAGDGMSSFM